MDSGPGGVLVPGSDMSGEVFRLGPDTKRFSIGDRVISADTLNWIDGPAPRSRPIAPASWEARRICLRARRAPCCSAAKSHTYRSKHSSRRGTDGMVCAGWARPRKSRPDRCSPEYGRCRVIRNSVCRCARRARYRGDEQRQTPWDFRLAGSRAAVAGASSCKPSEAR